MPPGVLYRVKATYKYQAEDMDELAFEVGELIDVIEYEDPEEQVRDQQNKIQYSFSSIIFSGRGMADGCQRINRTKRNVSSKFHPSNINHPAEFLHTQVQLTGFSS